MNNRIDTAEDGALVLTIRNALVQEAGRLQAQDGKAVEIGVALATFANVASPAQLITLRNVILGCETAAEYLRREAAGEFPIAN